MTLSFRDPKADSRQALKAAAREVSRVNTWTNLTEFWPPGDGLLTHTAFLPDRLSQPNLLTNLVNHAIRRALWVTRHFYGFEPDRELPGARAAVVARLMPLNYLIVTKSGQA